MMKMAQQSQEQQQPSPVSEGNPEDLKKIRALDEGTYQQLGMPTGEDDESMKQRLMILFDQLGLMKGLTQEGLLELQQQLDDYIKVLKTKDMNKIKNHRITKILDKAAKEIEAEAKKQGAAPQQGPAPQAAPQQGPTNFAGMVKPPMGGGMSGR